MRLIPQPSEAKSLGRPSPLQFPRPSLCSHRRVEATPSVTSLCHGAQERKGQNKGLLLIALAKSFPQASRCLLLNLIGQDWVTCPCLTTHRQRVATVGMVL